LALGNHERARKCIAKALQFQPEDVGVLQAMADVVFHCAEWHNVLGYYNKIIAKADQQEQVIKAFLMKSYVLDAKLQLTEKAVQHYVKSLAFDGRQPRVLLRLAELSLRDKDWPQAVRFADRGLELQEEQDDVEAGLYLARATASFACGDDGGGNANLKAALEADPSLGSPALEEGTRTVDSMAEALKERLMLHP
jgi:tetratricopeptide (TPR) repeat protein